MSVSSESNTHKLFTDDNWLTLIKIGLLSKRRRWEPEKRPGKDGPELYSINSLCISLLQANQPYLQTLYIYSRPSCQTNFSWFFWPTQALETPFIFSRRESFPDKNPFSFVPPTHTHKYSLSSPEEILLPYRTKEYSLNQVHTYIPTYYISHTTKFTSIPISVQIISDIDWRLEWWSVGSLAAKAPEKLSTQLVLSLTIPLHIMHALHYFVLHNPTRTLLKSTLARREWLQQQVLSFKSQVLRKKLHRLKQKH